MSDGAATDREAHMNRSEGERHLPEGMEPSSSALERTESHELDTLRMLQEAGLDESMPIDPSSLKALQELCTPKRSHGKMYVPDDTKLPALVNMEASEEEKEQEGPPTATLQRQVPAEVLRTTYALGRVTSDLTMGMRSEAVYEEETDASTAGSTQMMNDEKRILDQLQMQTALIMDLQRRVDDLTQIVLQQQGVPPPMQQFRAPVQQEAPRNMQQQPRHAAAPQEPPHHEMILLPRIANFICNIPAYIRSTRVAAICRIFWDVHARDMNGRIDGNLILKIVFMAAILMAKLTASNQRKKRDRTSALQFYVAVLLIVCGFMLQSGYARFLYNFFVKERYPQRIWNGEEVTVGPRPPVRQVMQAEADQQPAGILRGAIPRGAPAGGVGKVVTDIIYLFITLFLSILPMWKPEALQEQGNDQEEQQEPRENEREDDNDAPMDEGL